MALMKLHGWPLVGEALKRRSALLMDLALDVVVPPLSWLVAPAVLGVFVAGVLSWVAGFAFWSGWVFAACLSALSLYVLRGWMLSGVGPRGLLDLAYAPIYVLWKIKLMVSKPEEKKGEWVRTTREAETARQEGGGQ